MTSENIKKIPSSQPISQATVANILYEYIEGYLYEIFAMSDTQRLYDVYEIDEASDDGRVLLKYVEVFFGEDHFREEVLIGQVQKWTHHFWCYAEDGYWSADEAHQLDETTVGFDELENPEFHIGQISEWFLGWLWQDIEALEELLVENPKYDRQLEAAIRAKVVASLNEDTD